MGLRRRSLIRRLHHWPGPDGHTIHRTHDVVPVCLSQPGAVPPPSFVPKHSLILHAMDAGVSTSRPHRAKINGMDYLTRPAPAGSARHSHTSQAQARTAHTARPRTWTSGLANTARAPVPARTARTGTQTSGPAHPAHTHHTPRLALPPSQSSSSGQKPQAPRPRLDRCSPRSGGGAQPELLTSQVSGMHSSIWHRPDRGPAPGAQLALLMPRHPKGQARPRHVGHKGGHHWR